MCGIVGYVGDKSASPILIKGLKKLEYRGYDSAGIAIHGGSEINVVKAKGRIADLEAKLETVGTPSGTVGIGHTRWATHGAPSDVNAHPHVSNDGTIAVVHNGIIENYIELRDRLEKEGCIFISETDTEVLAHLFRHYYTGDLVDAMIQVIHDVRGSYALAVIAKDHPDEIVAVRKDSPMIVGLGKGENYLASDIPAILENTRNYYLLEDNEIVLLKRTSVRVCDMKKKRVPKDVYSVNWDISAAQKGGHDYFMQKEIMEQPKSVRDTISPRIENDRVKLEDLHMTEEQIRKIGRIHIVACGSAWHVGLVAKYVIEELCRIPVEVDLASEFRYRNPILSKDDICLVISQSGETADTLAALREAKRQGVRIISVVNVVGSSIARDSDDVLYTWAGPEIAVATTKAFSTQLSVIYLLAIHFALAKGLMDAAKEQELVAALQHLPEQIDELLEMSERLENLSVDYAKREDVFFIGRGVDYAISMEGSLKLKEISYIHSEAYAAGELKHGTISLIEPGTLVIALATQDSLFEKLLSNIKEVKARGAKVLALTTEGHREIEKEADDVIYLPKTFHLFEPSLNVIPLQIFAYYIAIARGCDVDKPRNLAKSVTVE